MLEELEKMANLNIPKDISSDEANKYLADACAKFEIKCPPPQTTARLLDKVCLLSSFCLGTKYLPGYIVSMLLFDWGQKFPCRGQCKLIHD